MDRTPSLSEIERLEGLARAATPGPWHVKDDWTPEGGLTVIANVDGEYDADGKPDCSYDTVLICEDDCGESLERSPHDAAFIAAANPQTILHLIQLLKDSADAIDAFALDFIMAHDASPPDSHLRLEAFQAAVRDLASVGVKVRQSLNGGASS